MASSMYGSQPSKPANIILMSRWKVAGEFFIPNGMTLYWNKPSGVSNAEISFALSVSGTCQNPFKRSNLITYLAFPMRYIQSSILGIGNESDLVTLFNFR
jgi:hypothetical protein